MNTSWFLGFDFQAICCDALCRFLATFFLHISYPFSLYLLKQQALRMVRLKWKNLYDYIS